MTSDQFCAELDRLGLTITGLARLLRMDSRAPRRWATGAQAIPFTIELLLHYYMEPEDVTDIAEMEVG